MITSDRDVFVGAHFTLETKEKFRLEAERRKLSMSALLSQIVENWLDAATSETIEPRRSNKRHLIDPLRDAPLPFMKEANGK